MLLTKDNYMKYIKILNEKQIENRQVELNYKRGINSFDVSYVCVPNEMVRTIIGKTFVLDNIKLSVKNDKIYYINVDYHDWVIPKSICIIYEE